MRRAPTNGYDFGQKRQYRRQLWSQVKALYLNQVSSRHALLMPSSEGDEIDVALSKGFREYNLHVVDENRAICAHLKRRYPRIHTYAGDVATIGARLVEAGVQLDFANLDLTGYLSDRFRRTVREFTWSGALHPCATVAVTALKGRERPETTAHLKYLKETSYTFSDVNGSDEQRQHYTRIVAMANLLMGRERPERDLQTTPLESDDETVDRWADVVRWGQYQSSVPMIWALFVLTPKTPVAIVGSPDLPAPDERLQLTGWQWAARLVWRNHVTGKPPQEYIVLRHEGLREVGSPFRQPRHGPRVVPLSRT